MLTANMDVRRAVRDSEHVLEWDAVPGVQTWEVRVAERRNVRDDYTAAAGQELAAETTTLVVPESSGTLRIHILGRGRDGRLVRRAVISGLSRENWDEKWQKRPSAA